MLFIDVGDKTVKRDGLDNIKHKVMLTGDNPLNSLKDPETAVWNSCMKQEWKGFPNNHWTVQFSKQACICKENQLQNQPHSWVWACFPLIQVKRQSFKAFYFILRQQEVNVLETAAEVDGVPCIVSVCRNVSYVLYTLYTIKYYPVLHMAQEHWLFQIKTCIGLNSIWSIARFLSAESYSESKDCSSVPAASKHPTRSPFRLNRLLLTTKEIHSIICNTADVVQNNPYHKKLNSQ